ncbi:MAG: UPF0365 family protein [Planctomycetota bacterium]|jgi:uncharacterized protein YqfA (UPF0365 family)|nr:MAG: UPF0365 family protein [Planctomycetota bacterium]
MTISLFAAADLANILLIGGGIFGAIIVLVLLFILGNFMGLYIKAWVTKSNVGFTDMIRMQLSNIDYRLVVNEKIKLTNAGIPIDIRELEQHVLTKGNLVRTVAGVINAKKASIELPWKTAAAIDLAGRDILEAVRYSVIPKVIDCPDPTKGRATLDGVCHNGIQLKARARVTVRTKLDRLVGGAGEETIIARVGEGIVKAIGSAASHKEIMANPNLISQAVLNNSLDSQTAFEIVSIDVAEIDVGANVGANLQAEQATADLRVAQAQAETRRANAVALAQENAAKVEENRALLVLAESEVPKAIAHAIREGKMGVMDYYNLQNLQSDTGMRSAIAGIGGKGAQPAQSG